MKDFIKGRCPVCSWQLDKKMWEKLVGKKVVGIQLVRGKDGKVCGSRVLRSPGELGVVWGLIKKRFLDALRNLAVWGWITKKDLLNAVGVYFVRGALVDYYEKEGKRAAGRSIFEYDGESKEGVLIRATSKPTVISREVLSYGR